MRMSPQNTSGDGLRNEIEMLKTLLALSRPTLHAFRVPIAEETPEALHVLPDSHSAWALRGSCIERSLSVHTRPARNSLSIGLER